MRTCKVTTAQDVPPTVAAMGETIREVIVVGGGVSGLTCAWRLKRAGVDVCLLEVQSEVGGCTRTQRRDGFLLEQGPFNLLVHDPAFETLLGEASREVQVVTASRTARRRYIYSRGRLHRVPTNPVALGTTRLLSIGARCRLLLGLAWSRRPGRRLPDQWHGLAQGGLDETIEQVAVRRFGQEVADTIVSAAVSGILAGDIRKLSLRACFPEVARIDANARSLIAYGLKSAIRRRRTAKGDPRASGHPPRRWRGLVSIDGGLGALTSALGRELGSDLLCGWSVQGVRAIREGFELYCRSGHAGARRLRCRRLVLAVPAVEASRLLKPLAPEAATIAGSIQSASLIVLNLGFRRADISHPLDGFGFVVPHNEPGFPLLGVLWADSIFPHHAPPACRLIRVFIGGARDPEAFHRTDEELLATALGALADLLGVSGKPVKFEACRHPAAIPQYHVGHIERIERFRAAVAARPGLYLIGNYLEGVSLNDCVRLATRVAGGIARASRGLQRVPTPEFAMQRGQDAPC